MYRHVGVLLCRDFGGLAELIGLKLAMTAIFITLGYVLSIGLWAKR